MIIDKKEIDGLTPVAEGYKIFNNDWTANFGNNYCYADGNGNVEGTVHKQEGFPKRCKNGLHFCENPLDCFRYYPVVQWNKFAKVRGYGHISRGDRDTKVAVEILEITKVLSFNDFLNEIKEYSKISDGSIIRYDYGINHGSGISNGYGISYGSGVSNSSGINHGCGINYGCGISDSSGISDGSGISGGAGISNGSGISGGSGISDGYGISYGFGISNGYGIRHGYGINRGSGISYGHGIENSYGIYKCKYIKNCKGLSESIMCLNTSGQNRVFNKKVGESRFEEINEKIQELRDGWCPMFTNAFDLREENGGLWENVPVPKISGISNIEAYKDMPKKLIEYFKSLPEFDSEIFKEITGIEV